MSRALWSACLGFAVAAGAGCVKEEKGKEAAPTAVAARPAEPARTAEAPEDAPEDAPEADDQEGTQEAPRGAADQKTACSLLSEAEATQLLGFTVTQSELADHDCRWESEEFKPGIKLSLVLPPDLNEFEIYANTDGATTLPNLGDKAVWAPAMSVLVVQKGERLLIFDLDNKNRQTDLKAKAIAVAERAVPRL